MQSGRTNEGAGRPPIDVSRSTLKAEAPVFVPRFAVQPQPQPPPQAQSQYDSGFSFSQGTPHDWLEHAAALMANTPAAFDEIMIPLTDCLNKCLEDAEGKPELIELHVHDIVEFIFKRSVLDAQFRYMGARMCNHFVHHLVNKTFRSVLLSRCQQEHQKRQALLNNPQQLFGYTLFMGEIMTNVRHEDNQTPMKFLAKPIMELLVLLLDNPKEPCIKCAFQLLKMTGALLSDKEKEDTNGKTEKLDIIFNKIDALLATESLDRRQRNMLECVVQQRANDWYRKRESETTNNGASAPTYVADDGTVFYSTPPASVRNRSSYNYRPPAPRFPPAVSQDQPPQVNNYPVPGVEQPNFYPQQQQPPANMPGNLPQGVMPAGYLPQQQGMTPELATYMAAMANEMVFYAEPEGEYPQYAQDDEMDDEMAAAFEVFLRDTHQK